MEYKELNKGFGTGVFIGIMAVIVLIIGGMLFASGVFDSGDKKSSDSSVSRDTNTEKKSGILSNIVDKVTGSDSMKCTTKSSTGNSVSYLNISKSKNEFRAYVEVFSPEGARTNRMWMEESGLYSVSDEDTTPGGLFTEYSLENDPTNSLRNVSGDIKSVEQSIQSQQTPGTTVKCVPWKFDTKVLTHPSNIQFATMEEMMQGF